MTTRFDFKREVDVSLNMKMECDSCMEELNFKVTDMDGVVSIEVEPCDRCLEEKYDDGHADGMEEADNE